MKKLSLLGNLIFVLTIATPFLSFVVLCIVGRADIFGSAGTIKYSWIAWLFIPVGIVSAIVGILLKKNNLKYKKNYVAAGICLTVLCLMGSYCFIFSDVFTSDMSVYTATEKTVSFDLPENVEVITEPWELYVVTNAVIIDNDEKANFESEIANSEKWTNQLSTKIQYLLPLPISYTAARFDYFLFYNLTTNQYNVYPPDGENVCVFIAYDCEKQWLLILSDYTIVLN